MGLDTTTNGALIDHPAGPYDIHNGTHSAGTVLAWVYPTDDTARQYIWNHIGGVGSIGEYGIQWRADLAGDNFECFRQRGTTYVQVTGAAANFAAYGINKWIFVAFQWNTSAANSSQRMFIGDRNLPAAEPSAYVTQTVGVGTIGSGSGAFRMGNGAVTSREFHGIVGWCGIWEQYLTTGQIIEQQFRPHVTPNCLLFTHYGWNGTSTQTDWSGNANGGAVTSATVARHVPLRPQFGSASRPSYIAGAPPAGFARSWGYILG